MRELLKMVLLLSLTGILAACGQRENTDIEDSSTNQAESVVVQASITEIKGNLIYVKPVPGSWELQSSSSFTLSADLIEKDADYEVGTVLEITYDGNIQETWPASFENITRVTVSDFRLPEIEFHAQYIRTNGYSEGEAYPKIFWIASNGELKEYYESNREKYDFASREHPYSDETIGFADALKRYDDVFFEENELLFVLLEEGSGSVRHKVTEIKAMLSQDNGKQYILQPVIERLIPYAGTDDMAEWHIIIEIRKKYGSAVSELKTPDITNTEYHEISGLSGLTDEREYVDTASVGGPYGQISAVIPGTWEAEAVPVDSDRLVTENGLYGLILKPNGASDGQIELFCTDFFGVCGTGLSSKEITLAGSIVHVGTFDEHEHWDFITFQSEKPQIVAMHTDCSSWTEDMWGEALLILDTVKFDESRKEGGIGQFIPESENDAIAVIMEVSHVTSSGLFVRFRQYDKRDVAELFYGEGYTLERLEGDSWVEVPQIIDNGAFTDVGYIIPAGGETEQEIDWEWLYGKLPSGTYRIGKLVWDSSNKTGHTDIPAYPLKTQFIIAD